MYYIKNADLPCVCCAESCTACKVLYFHEEFFFSTETSGCRILGVVFVQTGGKNLEQKKF